MPGPAHETERLRHLLTLEHEAIRACQAAIKAASPALRGEIAALMADHEERARALGLRLLASGGRPPTARDVQGGLAQRKKIPARGPDSRVVEALLAAEEELRARRDEVRESDEGLTLSHIEPLRRRLGRQEGR